MLFAGWGSDWNRKNACPPSSLRDGESCSQLILLQCSWTCRCPSPGLHPHISALVGTSSLFTASCWNNPLFRQHPSHLPSSAPVWRTRRERACTGLCGSCSNQPGIHQQVHPARHKPSSCIQVHNREIAKHQRFQQLIFLPLKTAPTCETFKRKELEASLLLSSTHNIYKDARLNGSK